jgi:hypothetical protein
MNKVCLWDHRIIRNQSVNKDFKSDPLLEQENTDILILNNTIILTSKDDDVIYSSNLILAHLDQKEDKNTLLDKNNFPNNCIDQQIFVLISSLPLEGNSCVIKESGGKARIVLFTQSLKILQSQEIFKKVINLSFSDAQKMIEVQSTYAIGWEEDPFFTQYDIPIAVYILCQCYLYLYYSQSNKPKETTHPQILELLKNQEPFDRPSDDKFKKVKLSSWWKKSLTSEDSEDLSWDKKGKKQWQSLLKVPDNQANAWDDLISQINREEEVSFEKVEAYYLKMHTTLSSK